MKPRKRRYPFAAGLLACIPLSIIGAESQQSIDSFKAEAAKAAEHIRGEHGFQPGGCAVNALLGGVIARSRDSSLQVGDRIVAVGDHAVRSTDSVFELVNALPVTGSVKFALVRKDVKLKVNIECMDSRESRSLILSAYDAAAAGNFAICAQRVADYEAKYVHLSYVYGLGRRCGIYAGQIIGEQIDNTYVTYWSLRLQELKYHPESIDEVRPAYLSAQNSLTTADKAFLADELRRQWTLATGEQLAPPPPALPPVQAASSPTPRAAAHVPLRQRSRSGSCEDGHWVQEILGDGALVKLEDGTLWEVDSADTVDSALWLPTTNIVICDGKLINTDDNESVDAEQVR